MISRQEVENLAKLSKLKFTDEELDSFTLEMADIIAFADTINQNIGDLEVMPESARIADMDELRADEVKPSLPNGDILSNADGSNGFFVVRRNCTR